MKCCDIRKSLEFSLKFIVFITLFILVFVLLSFRQLPKGPSPCLQDVACFDTAFFKKGKVIIDPGHGGADGGAVSEKGDKEKDFCLEYSLTLGAYLQSMGYEVLYTRDSDVMLESTGASTKKGADLKARVKLAKENPDAVFVSIHMNKFPQTKYSGLQVFYSKNDYRSELVATLIQNRICKDLQPQNTRSVKAAGGDIFVLDRILSPAILIECGFLSNENELLLLKSEEYQKQMCFVIAHALDASSRDLFKS